MPTSVRRVSDLIHEIDQGSLTLRPAFQRRLVWTGKVKDYFLETVIKGYPFPEIFVATGEVDTGNMKRQNMLVDGQQRLSALREYVHDSPGLPYAKVKPYSELTKEEKQKFLDYEVVVRDLGLVSDKEIRNIFARINSTTYSLKGMELANAQFSGEYKLFCASLAGHEFFVDHNVFTGPDVRRMRDIDFCVILVTTILSSYYNRDERNYEYLERYNDSFPTEPLSTQLEDIFKFLGSCGFTSKRPWKKTDLFTLIVELHQVLYTKSMSLDAATTGKQLNDFFLRVDTMYKQGVSASSGDAEASVDNVFTYLKAATKATNDKYARLERAEVISSILNSSAVPRKPPAPAKAVAPSKSKSGPSKVVRKKAAKGVPKRRSAG